MKLLKTIYLCMLLFIAISYGQDYEKFSVIINSVPYGAEVYVNNKYVAKTPCGFNAPQNFSMDIEVKKEGYTSWRNHYRILKTIHIDVTLNALTPKMSIEPNYPLKLTSLPSDASVSIDGELRGYTPFDQMMPTGSQLDVAMRKDGYEEWRQTITINDEIRKTIKLERKEKSSKAVWVIAGTALIAVGTYTYLNNESGNGGGGSSTTVWPQPPGRP